MKHECNFQAVINDRMNLGYMEELKHGYSWTDYVNREYLPEVPEYYFAHFIQATKNFRANEIKWLLNHETC